MRREGARALGQLAEVLPAALAHGDPAERLAAALGGYLEAVRADPATWRLVLVPHEGAPAVLHEAISRGRAAVVAQLAAALGDGERGLARPTPSWRPTCCPRWPTRPRGCCSPSRTATRPSACSRSRAGSWRGWFRPCDLRTGGCAAP